MPDNYLKQWWNHDRNVTMLFLVGFAIFGIIALASLRSNNLQMVKLREAVYAADKQDGDTETALRNLRTYIYSHMNTSPSVGANGIKPPIQLKYEYERLVATEKAKTAAANAQIYTAAQAYCEKQNSSSFSGRSRVPCIEEYVSQHGVKEKSIPDSLYKFDFVSPKWSPDLAGWSLVLAVICLVGFVISFGLRRYTRSNIKKHA